MDAPTRSIAGIPFLKVYCQRLYISSEGLDITAFTFGGLVKFLIGCGLMNELSLTETFSCEVKSVSILLRHLLLCETYLSGIVGCSLSPARMLANDDFVVNFNFLNDLKFSLEF